jgi:transposase-like protein
MRTSIRPRRIYLAEEKAKFVINCLTSNSSIANCCRVSGISPANYYRWKNTFVTGGTRALKTKVKQIRSNISDQSELEKCAYEESKLLIRYLNFLRPTTPPYCHLPAKVKFEIIEILDNISISKSRALKIIGVHKSRYYRWKRKLSDTGRFGRDLAPPQKVRIYERTEIKDTVFKVLHSPPSEYGYNRTTWKFDDLQKAIESTGVQVGRHSIRRIIKTAGYRWLKAKKVLTSADPNYRDKLNQIHSVLGNLGEREGFFSIDEYGPFAIKQRQGKKLIAPGESFTVPQWQKSKGALIMTAALELSTNQVTHFYSKKKDTEEIIKLLDLLLVKYKHLNKIYLSWDAASWHVSKKLFKKIKENNSIAKSIGSPLIDVTPLPAGAQFLNVIEAVFSGMSRAIIHNSNYQSIKEAKKAIDKYYFDRNKFFKENPKRAGQKIWGEELVRSHFAESANFKDPKYR